MLTALPPGLEAARLVGAEEARARADIVAFLVAHRPFRGLDRRRFLDKAVVDLVGLMAEA
jgi:UDP-N-acetyl-D-mannosaminuronate dehydrogenase